MAILKFRNIFRFTFGRPKFQAPPHPAPINIFTCRPRSGGHPSEYWSRAILLTLGESLSTGHLPHIECCRLIILLLLFYLPYIKVAYKAAIPDVTIHVSCASFNLYRKCRQVAREQDKVGESCCWEKIHEGTTLFSGRIISCRCEELLGSPARDSTTRNHTARMEICPLLSIPEKSVSIGI